MIKLFLSMLLIFAMLLAGCNKIGGDSTEKAINSIVQRTEKSINTISQTKDSSSNSDEKVRPDSNEIIEIYSSAEVGHLDKSLLSVKQENSDGAIDITIETANGYVHSYFDGDYIVFENKTFDDKIVGVALRYNYVTESNVKANLNAEIIPDQDDLLSIFADNFEIEKDRLAVKDQNDNGGFKIAIADFEGEVEVSISDTFVIFKIINFRGELVDTIIYDHVTKTATFK